jgi:hypothetical protein
VPAAGHELLARGGHLALMEPDVGHGMQLDAIRRLPGHVVDFIEEAEPANEDPLVHVLP